MTALNPDPSDAPKAQLPKVFVRVFSTPPGMPWDQSRAARLEAVHGAPVPIAELVHQLRRISSWAAGRPGRFAVFYVRSEEFIAPFESTVEVDGAPTLVAFGTKAGSLRNARKGALVALLIVGVGGVLGTGISLAIRARAQGDTQLEAAERNAASYLQSAKTQWRRKLIARDLDRELGSSRQVSDVLGDLAWVTAARASDAKIEVLHWDHGLMAVEARGDTSPFMAIDRSIERSSRPIRSKTWLWGVGPQGADMSAAGSLGP